MPDYVRVRAANGHETTVGRAHAEASDDLTILDEPATRPDGTVRPETRKNGRPLLPRRSVDQAVQQSAAEQPATPQRSAAKKAPARKKAAKRSATNA